MKLAFVLLGATVTAGFMAMAIAAPATPAWSCNTQDTKLFQKVNECRRQCTVGKDAKRQLCLDTMRSCRSACADDACKTKCVDDGNKCIKDNETAVQKCGDDCVTSNGCTL
jgi:hypothetical protein